MADATTETPQKEARGVFAAAAVKTPDLTSVRQEATPAEAPEKSVLSALADESTTSVTPTSAAHLFGTPVASPEKQKSEGEETKVDDDENALVAELREKCARLERELETVKQTNTNAAVVHSVPPRASSDGLVVPVRSSSKPTKKTAQISTTIEDAPSTIKGLSRVLDDLEKGFRLNLNAFHEKRDEGDSSNATDDAFSTSSKALSGEISSLHAHVCKEIPKDVAPARMTLEDVQASYFANEWALSDAAERLNDDVRADDDDDEEDEEDEKENEEVELLCVRARTSKEATERLVDVVDYRRTLASAAPSSVRDRVDQLEAVRLTAQTYERARGYYGALRAAEAKISAFETRVGRPETDDVMTVVVDSSGERGTLVVVKDAENETPPPSNGNEFLRPTVAGEADAVEAILKSLENAREATTREVGSVDTFASLLREANAMKSAAPAIPSSAARGASDAEARLVRNAQVQAVRDDKIDFTADDGKLLSLIVGDAPAVTSSGAPVAPPTLAAPPSFSFDPSSIVVAEPEKKEEEAPPSKTLDDVTAKIASSPTVPPSKGLSFGADVVASLETTPAEAAVPVVAPASLAPTTVDVKPSTLPYDQDPSLDAKTRLIRFYEAHNPAKISSVDAALAKYAGKERDLFLNLEKKYGVKSGFDFGGGGAAASSTFGNLGSTKGAAQSGFGAFTTPATGGFGGTPPTASMGASSPGVGGGIGGGAFGQTTPSTTTTGGGFGALASSSAAPAWGGSTPNASFGAPTKTSAFGSSPQQPLGAFGTPSAGAQAPSSGFGGSASSGFGGSASSGFGGSGGGSGFGQSSFGGSGFGQSSAASSSFNGGSNAGAVDYRSKLVTFYQQWNPSKLGQVDQTLAKYRGKETQLFAALLQKYPGATIAGVPGVGGAASTGFGQSGFGSATVQQSSSGGFGQTGFGAQPSGLVGGGFGAASTFGGAAPASNSGGGFGSFAQPQQQGFGAASSGGFGAVSSGGFGAAANQGGGGGFGGTATSGFNSFSTDFTAMRK